MKFFETKGLVWRSIALIESVLSEVRDLRQDVRKLTTMAAAMKQERQINVPFVGTPYPTALEPSPQWNLLEQLTKQSKMQPPRDLKGLDGDSPYAPVAPSKPSDDIRSALKSNGKPLDFENFAAVTAAKAAQQQANKHGVPVQLPGDHLKEYNNE